MISSSLKAVSIAPISLWLAHGLTVPSLKMGPAFNTFQDDRPFWEFPTLNNRMLSFLVNPIPSLSNDTVERSSGYTVLVWATVVFLALIRYARHHPGWIDARQVVTETTNIQGTTRRIRPQLIMPREYKTFLLSGKCCFTLSNGSNSGFLVWRVHQVSNNQVCPCLLSEGIRLLIEIFAVHCPRWFDYLFFLAIHCLFSRTEQNWKQWCGFQAMTWPREERSSAIVRLVNSLSSDN